MRRYIEGPTEPYVEFVDDAPNGGCIVKCPYCGETFNEKGEHCCPECLKDIVFPNWIDW